MDATRPPLNGERYGLTVPHLLEIRASALGDTLAVRAADGDLTYGAWLDDAARCAEMLRSEVGVRRGDRVMLWLDGDAASVYWVGYVAVLSLGAVAVPVDERAGVDEVLTLMNEAQPVALITARRQYSALHGLVWAANPPGSDPEGMVLRVVGGRIGEGRVRRVIDRSGAQVSIALRNDAKVGEPATLTFPWSQGRPVRSKAVLTAHSTARFDWLVNQGWASPRGGRRLGPGDVIQSPMAITATTDSVLTALFAGCRAVLEAPGFDTVRSEQLMAQQGTTIYNGGSEHFRRMTQAPPPDLAPSDLTLLVVSPAFDSGQVRDGMVRRWPGIPIVEADNACGEPRPPGSDL